MIIKALYKYTYLFNVLYGLRYVLDAGPNATRYAAVALLLRLVAATASDV